MVIVASCDQCNLYSNKPAMINKFDTENSNTTQGKTANLKYNVQNANLLRVKADYNKDGTISESEKDDILDYQGRDAVFTTRALDKVGYLEFKLIANGSDGADVTAKTNTNVIAHALPDLVSSDFSGIEGKTITFELPTIEGVEYTTISVSNDNSKIIGSTLDKIANKFTVQASEDITEQGSYDVQFGYKIPETGMTGMISKAGNLIKNLCRVQGRLEVTREKGILKPGETRMYNESTWGNPIAQKIIDDGLIDFTAESPADAISFQAQGPANSFKYKLTLDGKKDYLVKNGEFKFADGEITNYGAITVRPDHGVGSYTLAELRAQHMKANSGYAGLLKPNLKYFEILREDPAGGGAYTEVLQEQLANIIKTDAGIRNFFGGVDLSNKVQVDGAGNVPPVGGINNFTLYGQNNVSPNNFYVIIIPSDVSTDEVIQCYKDGRKGSGQVIGVRIKMRSDRISPATVKHAIGHAIYAYLSHIDNTYKNDTIMSTSTDRIDYGDIDFFISGTTTDDKYYPAQPPNKTHALNWGAYESL